MTGRAIACAVFCACAAGCDVSALQVYDGGATGADATAPVADSGFFDASLDGDASARDVDSIAEDASLPRDAELIGEDASVARDADFVPDAQGEDAFVPDACVPSCAGDELDDCNAVTLCALGCSIDPAPHCRVLVPSNGANPAELGGVTGALSSAGTTAMRIDTDTGLIERDGAPPLRNTGLGLVDGIHFRLSGSNLAFMTVATASIARNVTVDVYGSRALILLSGGEFFSAGIIDASGGRCAFTGVLSPECAGPGAGRGGSELGPARGCAPGGRGDDNGDTGGGGGGFGSAGGNGGDEPGGGTGGRGAIPASPPCTGEELIPLVGGSGGGMAGGGGGHGGGGGGGLQITSLTRIVLIDGGINTGGAGGAAETGHGGGGGGSGGAILLEAPEIIVRGILAANGGSGGEGGGPTEGTAGLLGSMPAIAPRDAGDGAALGVAAGNATSAPSNSGGGGGGLGKIRINAPPVSRNLGSATISPAPSLGEPVLE